MARWDRTKLTADGLDVPAVDHMFNKNALNALLDRMFGGNPSSVASWPLMGLWMNFVRLTDKALREYDAARAELLDYVAAPDAGSLRTSPYLRAVDHFENCVGATHRAVLDAKALRAAGIGRSGPRLTDRQEQRLRQLRHTIEHTDERLVPNRRRKTAPVFKPGQPFAIRLSDRGLVIGEDDLTYKELVVVLAKMYRTLEAIRGPSVRPGDTWTNARLRTDVGPPPPPGTMRPTAYTRELSRLSVSH